MSSTYVHIIPNMNFLEPFLFILTVADACRQWENAFNDIRLPLPKKFLKRIGISGDDYGNTWASGDRLQDSAREAELQFLAMKLNKVIIQTGRGENAEIKIKQYVSKKLLPIPIYDYHFPGVSDLNTVCAKVLSYLFFQSNGVSYDVNGMEPRYEDVIVAILYWRERDRSHRALRCPCIFNRESPTDINRSNDTWNVCTDGSVYISNGTSALHQRNKRFESYFVFQKLKGTPVTSNHNAEVRPLAHMLIIGDSLRDPTIHRPADPKNVSMEPR